MNRKATLQANRARRIARTRAKVSGTADRPRLTVRRSLAHIYAQVIDDLTARTLAAASDTELDTKDTQGKTKTEVATAVGKLVAERAKAKGVERVVFDRRDKKFHGRVKAVAEGARAAGLEF